MSNATRKSPEKPPLHPGKRFLFAALPGIAAGCLLTVIAFNMVKVFASAPTIKMALSLVGAVLFVASAYVGVRLRAWGWSGFLLGACAPVAVFSMASIVSA